LSSFAVCPAIINAGSALGPGRSNYLIWLRADPLAECHEREKTHTSGWQNWLPTAQIFSQMHPPLSTKKFVFVEEIMSRRRSLLAEKKALPRVFIFVIIYLLHLEIDNAARHTHTLKMAKRRECIRISSVIVWAGAGTQQRGCSGCIQKDEYIRVAKKRASLQLPRGFSGQQRARLLIFLCASGEEFLGLHVTCFQNPLHAC
jgi:hypothetical protein